MKYDSVEIKLSGRVQGVGFRPFVYRIAYKYNIKGLVSNNENGVFIIAQGDEVDIQKFYSDLLLLAPKSSKIDTHSLQKSSLEKSYTHFSIHDTSVNVRYDNPITPDFAICDACKQDLLSPNNRRYLYPFTTCTQCGPRYAISLRFPFERENTSMCEFAMCEDCALEYQNTNDKRFFSQTNSCPKCGISLEISEKGQTISLVDNHEIFTYIAQKLSEGKIVALKNTGGYLLLCDATNPKAIGELRERKKRAKKPFAILLKSIDVARQYVQVSKKAAQILSSSVAPITLLPILPQTGLPIDIIAPNLTHLGVMVPYSGLLTLLCHYFENPLIATSGNVHHAPLCSSKEEAELHLADIADVFVHHNLTIEHPQDDSVVKLSHKHERDILSRRARGLAPEIDSRLDNKGEKLLSTGSDLKNSILVVPQRYGYMSEYLGDLDNYDTQQRHIQRVNNYKAIFEFEPDVMVSDMHPNYRGIDLQTSSKAKKVAVQHHEAHFAAILQEHHLWNQNSPILGIVWDGVGYMNENEIGGGEFFSYHQSTIKRIAHVEHYDWILGNEMSKQCRLSALSLGVGKAEKFTENEWRYYHKLLQNNSLKTTSMGRLFDAVAYVLELSTQNSYEGESAMYVEQAASEAFHNGITTYQDYLKDFDGSYSTEISAKNILQNIAQDKARGIPVEEIALNFHYTLVQIVRKIVVANKFKHIAFSGGVFQNGLLIDLLLDILGGEYELYFHQSIPANDENISYGQAAWYLNCKK